MFLFSTVLEWILACASMTGRASLADLRMVSSLLNRQDEQDWMDTGLRQYDVGRVVGAYDLPGSNQVRK